MILINSFYDPSVLGDRIELVYRDFTYSEVVYKNDDFTVEDRMKELKENVPKHYDEIFKEAVEKEDEWNSSVLNFKEEDND